MPNQQPPDRYGATAQVFHWLIAALIVTQFALAWTADDLPLGVHKLALLARHKSVGMTVLMLAVPPPPGPRAAESVAGIPSTHGCDPRRSTPE